MESILVRVGRLRRDCNWEGSSFLHQDFQQPNPPLIIHPAKFDLEDRVSIVSDQHPPAEAIYTDGSHLEGETARALHKQTEDTSNFNWTEECEKSFNSLKQALIASPIFIYPRTDKEFILDTDASNEGIGAVFSQKIGNEECVIAYFSKSLGWCLYRKWESDDGSSCRWQLILPKSRIQEVLRETYDNASGGHFGVMKTLSKTREIFYWHRLCAIEKWCRECHACGAKKGPKTRTKGRLQRYNVGALFDRMALDILGPFPVTTKGNRYVLVLMDYFTKWPEAIPIPDQGASTVACSDLDFALWCTYDIAFGSRSADHEVTRFIPADMLFGRTLRLPCDILSDTPSSSNEYLNNLETRLEGVHAFARE
ncbi:hypothetical protein AVEN_54607-1 [Araneus ventricosus]|uniref:RNA-directed DNA polymerase n=1 Tax=Araneus ventricosus TaxID=182803 RepID=A0A4Y2BMM4_ARAVE|nr:hypothetical protein AVEN_54607-1 [Araneus ventricosus]